MSKIIKPLYYAAIEEKKQLVPAPVTVQRPFHSTVGMPEDGEQLALQQTMDMKNQVLRDAEAVAEEQIRLAMEESAAVREQALSEIDEWWQERRDLDQQVEEEARRLGYEAGFEEGLRQAEAKLQEQYAGMLKEARTVLEQAYEMKDQLLKESEPFLIELSTAIAEKIIRHELTAHPEWMLDITRTMLSRKREKGVVTLCVSPEDFAYIRDARDELQLAVDSQAELQILPDATVGRHGCVVRTDFGSVDARVDTQLREIKQALQQLSFESEEGAEKW